MKKNMVLRAIFLYFFKLKIEYKSLADFFIDFFELFIVIITIQAVLVD